MGCLNVDISNKNLEELTIEVVQVGAGTVQHPLPRVLITPVGGNLSITAGLVCNVDYNGTMVLLVDEGELFVEEGNLRVKKEVV